MSVITILIGLGLLVALGFLAAFTWAVRDGQYDDTYTPSLRMLHDEATPIISQKKPTSETEQQH